MAEPNQNVNSTQPTKSGVWAFCKENMRILAELKRYVEAQPKQGNFTS